MLRIPGSDELRLLGVFYPAGSPSVRYDVFFFTVSTVIIYLTNQKPFAKMFSLWQTKPKTLQEAIIYFSNPDNCLDLLGCSPLAEWRYLPDLWP